MGAAAAGRRPEAGDSDSAESAGPSGDESAGDAGEDDGASSPESAGPSGDEPDSASDRAINRAARRRGRSERAENDDTAFSDGEEAPLMSPAAVAAALQGLEEPSSEDDDDEEGGGMLADVDDSGEDSDAAPEGAPHLEPAARRDPHGNGQRPGRCHSR